MSRTMLCADPAEMVRTLRTLIRIGREDVERMEAELRTWELAAGKRPGDGSDQPPLFDNARQPNLW